LIASVRFSRPDPTPQSLRASGIRGAVHCVITMAPTFGAFVTEAFERIGGSAEGNVAIMARMLSAFETLADLTTSPRRRRALHEQVRRVAELAGRTTEATHDRDRIAKRLMEVRKTLEAEPASTTEGTTA
jgi:uncharacterized membrane protein